MHLPDLKIAGTATRVGIGEYLIGDLDSSMRATLGSCVGLCLVQPTRLRFALAHILLPTPADGVVPQGRAMTRYASTTVPFLLDALEVPLVERRTLRAFIAGGAQMYESDGQRSTVGADNQTALTDALVANKIRISKSDLGGPYGRQLVADGPTKSIYSIVMEDPERSLQWELPPQFHKGIPKDPTP